MKDVLVSGNHPAESFLEWLATLSDSKDIERTFRGIIAAAFGPEDVPATDFFQLITATSGKGTGLARRGLIHLMGGIAKSIKDRGGEVWTRASATGIALDGNRTTGVLVDRAGQLCTVSAKLVVSNAGPHQTARLVGPENLDSEYQSVLNERAQAVTSISLHLISDRNLLADIPGAVYTAIGARRIAMIFDVTQTADWAPSGTHITEIYPLTVEDPGMTVDWEQQIEEVGQDLDDMSPGWRDHAELKAITLGGEFPGLHAWPGSGVDVETPISNLLLVGDGVESKGFAGGAAAAESAQRAAAAAHEYLTK
jgi:phytoene dehydrogenase-like protein